MKLVSVLTAIGILISSAVYADCPCEKKPAPEKPKPVPVVTKPLPPKPKVITKTVTIRDTVTVVDTLCCVKEIHYQPPVIEHKKTNWTPVVWIGAAMVTGIVLLNRDTKDKYYYTTVVEKCDKKY